MRAGLGALTLAGATALCACHQATAPSPATGLKGVVVRGPVAPVCQVSVPCDAPFSATFSVQQNARAVAQFHSSADGTFTVFLAEGVYTIVPAADAPIISPRSQTKTVQVLASGLTEVRLEFDTGIR